MSSDPEAVMMDCNDKSNLTGSVSTTDQEFISSGESQIPTQSLSFYERYLQLLDDTRNGQDSSNSE